MGTCPLKVVKCPDIVSKLTKIWFRNILGQLKNRGAIPVNLTFCMRGFISITIEINYASHVQTF